jgi:hypothetical protein
VKTQARVDAVGCVPTARLLPSISFPKLLSPTQRHIGCGCFSSFAELKPCAQVVVDLEGGYSPQPDKRRKKALAPGYFLNQGDAVRLNMTLQEDSQTLEIVEVWLRV